VVTPRQVREAARYKGNCVSLKILREHRDQPSAPPDVYHSGSLIACGVESSHLPNGPVGHSDQAVPPREASHRNRKKCRPHSEHRYGRSTQWSTFSKTFRTPTLLKSTDLQCGQREEDTSYRSAISSVATESSVFAVLPVPEGYFGMRVRISLAIDVAYEEDPFIMWRVSQGTIPGSNRGDGHSATLKFEREQFLLSRVSEMRIRGFD
jgi:hypothetical protein